MKYSPGKLIPIPSSPTVRVTHRSSRWTDDPHRRQARGAHEMLPADAGRFSASRPDTPDPARRVAPLEMIAIAGGPRRTRPRLRTSTRLLDEPLAAMAVVSPSLGSPENPRARLDPARASRSTHALARALRAADRPGQCPPERAVACGRENAYRRSCERRPL